MFPLDVTIIVVNWNTKDYLVQCLASIFVETEGITFEVIVVDNGSTDGSVELVEQGFPQVKLIANTENKGFPAANNQGIAISHGKYVLLLNSDTIVLDGAIQKLITFVNQHPEAGAAGGLMLKRDGSIDPICFLTRFDAIGVWQYYLLWHKIKKPHLAREFWETDILLGAFMLVRQTVIQQIGGMDESFFLMSEDTDWCLRVRQAGWKIYYHPASKIIHYGSESFKRSWDRGIITAYNSKEMLFQKYYGRGSMISLRIATLFGSLLRLMGWSVSAIMKPGELRYDAQLRCYAYWQVIKQAITGQSYQTSRQAMEHYNENSG